MKESDIRPKELFDEYLRLSSQDIDCYFSKKKRVTIVCPACNQTQNQFAFKKNDFDFAECVECQTLYLSPRPPLDEFERYYSNSPSAQFWVKNFYPVVIESRRNKIFQPNVEKIRSICNKKKIEVTTIIDVGAGYGIFLEEWGKKEPKTKLIGIEPLSDLSEICQSKGIDVIPSVVEKAGNLEKKADLVVCFEVIEHVHDPLLFVKVIRKMVAPGGIAVFTGLGVDGFDIQVLWENSKSVFPPHHINFMSVDGFHKLFMRAGFSEVEVMTPGKLDVDIILNNKELLTKENRFIKTLLNRGDETLAELQKFLTKHRLSSHCWVLASN
jgi:SAM-dependent methyltransferase